MMPLPTLQSIRRYRRRDPTGSIRSSRWLLVLLTGASLLLYPALAAGQMPTVPPSAAPPDDGQWTMPAKNYAATRYSGLDEINDANVEQSAGRLHLLDRRRPRARSGADRGEQHHVHRDAISEHRLCARSHQARRADQMGVSAASGAGVARVSPAATSSIAARPTRTASSSSTPSTATPSRSTPETGKELWKTKLGDINTGETHHDGAAGREGKVLVGDFGGELGVRGWVDGARCRHRQDRLAGLCHRAGQGRADRPRTSSPFYPSDKGADLGVKTWPADAWKTGGGTMWGWIAYDPDLNLIYYGTGNPGPWNQEQRPATTNGRHDALRARSRYRRGQMVRMQYNPHDEHDYDGINEIRSCVDMPVDGKPRKVLLHPDRNGYLYVVDRETGEVVSAEPYGYVNSVLRHRSQDRPARHQPGQGRRSSGPSSTTSARRRPDVKDWNPSAFSPLHRPASTSRTRTSAWIGRAGQVNYIAGTPYRRRRGRDESRAPAAIAASSPPGIQCRARPVWTDQGGPAAVERRDGHRRRPCLLRNHGWLVQSRRRQDRRAQMAVQDRLGDHRPARRLSRAGRA